MSNLLKTEVDMHYVDATSGKISTPCLNNRLILVT